MRPIHLFASFVVLAAVARAQSAGPLLITENAVFPLGDDDAPSLSLDGNQLVARQMHFLGIPPPSPAHIFTRTAQTWSELQSFTVPGCSAMGAFDKMNVSVRGTRLVIGVTNGVEAQGDVRISDFSGGSWGPLEVVHVPDDFNNFGAAVLTREGVVFVGEPDTSLPAGGVDVFRRVGPGWELVNSWFSPLSGFGTYGSALADSGDTLLVAGTHGVDVRVRGATSIDWIHQASIEPAGTTTVLSIAIDGDTAVIGYVTGPTTYHASVYERTVTTWTLTTALSVPGMLTNESFGWSVGVHGDTVYVGAPGKDFNQGAVYVFQRQAGTFAPIATIRASVPIGNARFGRTLAVDGTTLAVGAQSSNAGLLGSLYLFDIASIAPAQTYCTAKANSQGCLPLIAAVGIPGATNPGAFSISASNEINHKSGFLLYSIAGAAATPFQGGTLCLAAPLHRTPAQNSGGNSGPADCSGTYAFNFNALVQGGTNPALAPGVQVWAQFYSRDPGDPFMVGLTDAVVFTIGS